MPYIFHPWSTTPLPFRIIFKETPPHIFSLGSSISYALSPPGFLTLPIGVSGPTYMVVGSLSPTLLPSLGNQHGPVPSLVRDHNALTLLWTNGLHPSPPVTPTICLQCYFKATSSLSLAHLYRDTFSSPSTHIPAPVLPSPTIILRPLRCCQSLCMVPFMQWGAAPDLHALWQAAAGQLWGSSLHGVSLTMLHALIPARPF